MQPLPIDPSLPEITSAVRGQRALVLVAPPGSGKTTRVPPALLDELDPSGKIVVLQPRRVAARAAAARMAEERGWTVGNEVGYQVRFERKTSRRTRIEVVTEGILTRRLQSDPFLEDVSVVILDEFHERSIHTDLALAILRELRMEVRPDLAVVVMSATLDPGPVASFLGGAPVVTAGGRPHAVDVRYLDAPDRSPVWELAARAVQESWRDAQGHALVFLAGLHEIRRTAAELEGFARAAGAVITPLHGSLTLDEQERALRPSKTRKIVLSTNLAETSLTIDGVDLVIDSGYARQLRNDPRHGIDRLEVTRISKSSAEQRAGRAGRLGPGKALRLWTRAEHSALPESDAPEVRRIDLAAVVLELRAWGAADPARFGWFEAPEPAALERAEGLLVDLGAVESRNGPITLVGRSLLAIPAHPRLARVIAAASEEGLLEEGAALAALIEERDIVSVSAGPWRPGPASARAHLDRGHRDREHRETGPSDLLRRLDFFAEVEAAGFRTDAARAMGVNADAARAVARSRDALARSARGALEYEAQRAKQPQRVASAENDASGAEAALLRALLRGYPDRVCRRRSAGSDRGRMTGGRGVVLDPESIVRDDELFLAIDLDESVKSERLEARVHSASAVRRQWIEQAFPLSIAERFETWFDPEAEKVKAHAAMSYRDLPLEEPRPTRPPGPEAEKLLARAAREHAEKLFAADEEAFAWLMRARCLREWMPELGLPSLGAAELGEALAASCTGKTSFAELRAMGLLGLARSLLTHAQAAAVDQHAPEALRVPTGNRIRLRYEPGKAPVLAVRLQELFGVAATPAVAAGRVPVLLHLLGPNYRPVQITQDLASFWTTTYAQVRKDLRARYPKHAWPEDPWTAPPQAGARRRR